MINRAWQLLCELLLVRRIAGWGCFFRFLFAVLRHVPQVVRRRSLAPADQALAGSEIAFRVLGEEIVLPGKLFGLGREIYGRQVYFAGPGFSLRPEDTVVDLGAHAGVFTVLAARLVRRVVAVEAQSGFLSEMEANLSRNGGRAEVKAFLGLVGGRRGTLSDLGRLQSASHFGTMPPPLTMPELFAAHDLERVDLLKVDIEGSEFDLFDGNVGWLERVQRIAAEIHPEFGDVDTLCRTLESAGFLLELRGREGKRVGRRLSASAFLYAWRPANEPEPSLANTA